LVIQENEQSVADSMDLTEMRTKLLLKQMECLELQRKKIELELEQANAITESQRTEEQGSSSLGTEPSMTLLRPTPQINNDPYLCQMVFTFFVD
jgi:Pcf11-like protein